MTFIDTAKTIKSSRDSLLSDDPKMSLRKQASQLGISRPQLDAVIYFFEVMEGHISDELSSGLSQSTVRLIAKAQIRFGQDDRHKAWWQAMLAKLVSITPATVVEDTISLATSIKNNDLASGNRCGNEVATVATLEPPGATPEPPGRATTEPPSNVSPFKGNRASAELCIYTYFARALVLGKKPMFDGDRQITGLFLFSSKVAKVIAGAESFCPEAIKKLVELEQAMTGFSEEFKPVNDLVNDLHDEKEDRIKIVDISKPVDTFDLSFSSPYPYLVADIIKKYDQVIRETLSLRHLGRMRANAGDKIARRFAGRIRAILAMADSYKYSGQQADIDTVELPSLLSIDKLKVMM